MKYGISLLALLCAWSIGTAQVDAQGRGKGQANRPTAAGAKQGGAKADQGRPVTAKGPKQTKTKAAPVAGTEARVKGNPHNKTTTAPMGNVRPDTPTTTYVKNPRLEERLRLMLPAGMTVQDASLGFKNWGQFVAAVHVSRNLGLDFNALKAAMTGIPVGSPPGTLPTTAPLSLGQAIHSLPRTTPTTDGQTLTTSKIQTEVKKAEDAANADLRRTRERS
jgi:hypothetical protein